MIFSRAPVLTDPSPSPLCGGPARRGPMKMLSIGVSRGIRRLTLNDNIDLGDEAAADLFETLKDDPFVKAIDMQNCGLTNRGAQLALSTLIVNDALAVLDVRNNPQISAAMLTAVMTRLYENGANNPDVGRWKWTRLGRDVTWDPSSSATFV